MKKIIILLFLTLIITACSPYKPPLDETQLVNGKSIVIPPNFDQLPKEK